MRIRNDIIYLFSLLSGGTVMSQELAVANRFPVDGKVERYIEKAGNQALLYTGELEPQYLNRLEGHPYLDTKEYRTGTLAFDGIIYPGVDMRLNVHIGCLVVLSPDRRLNLIVPSDRIGFARFPGYDCFYMAPQGEKGALPEGFYVRLHDGDVSLWKRTEKGLEERREELTLTNFFVERNAYYICKEGLFYPVNSKRELLKLFKGQDDLLNRYIKEQRLSFSRGERERTLMRIMEYIVRPNI